MTTPKRTETWKSAPALREEALRLCQRAAERGVPLRITGSLAVLIHCPAHANLLESLGRRPVRDVDLMAYLRDQRKIESLFTEEGWVLDPVIRLGQEWGIKRLIYVSRDGAFKVDVFLDQLVMSHTVDLRRRLELDNPTLSPVDLLLSKLQIHAITQNDVLDIIVLLAEHELGDGLADTIERARLLRVLSDDWGFWYTAGANLDRVLAALDAYAGLPPDVASVVRTRIGRIREAMDAEPKSRRWLLRSAVGTRLAWYQDVDEVERGEGSEPA
ncbi:MAG: hypothetical protein ABSD62_13680 [Candidatus Limnocylindrales bacterium]